MLVIGLTKEEEGKDLALKTQMTPQRLNVDNSNEDGGFEETDSPTILMIQLH